MNNFEVLKEFEGSKILITGATGLIGRTLIKKIFDWNRRTDRPIKAAALVRNEQKAAAVLADEIADGLEQTVGYMDLVGSVDEGHLIIFDRTQERTWDERLWHRTCQHRDHAVMVWGM